MKTKNIFLALLTPSIKTKFYFMGVGYNTYIFAS